MQDQGDHLLDAAVVVDAGTWRSEAAAAVAKLLSDAADAAARASPTSGKTVGPRSVRRVVEQVIEHVTQGAGISADRLVRLVSDLDNRGEAIDTIVAAVREQIPALGRWALAT